MKYWVDFCSQNTMPCGDKAGSHHKRRKKVNYNIIKHCFLTHILKKAKPESGSTSPAAISKPLKSITMFKCLQHSQLGFAFSLPISINSEYYLLDQPVHSCLVTEKVRKTWAIPYPLGIWLVLQSSKKKTWSSL